MKLELTNEQIHILEQRFEARRNMCSDRAQVENLLDAYHAMLNASPTHRVVKAPEGYEITSNAICKYKEGGPTGCPAPVLEPVTVTVTVESIYGCIPKLPDGYEAVFALTERSNGWNHYLNVFGHVVEIEPDDKPLYRILLRKWEPK